MHKKKGHAPPIKGTSRKKVETKLPITVKRGWVLCYESHRKQKYFKGIENIYIKLEKYG